ncbi:MAG: hypothetical protein RLY20_967 [Verrucomicrobiota bacterium]|jgi:signal transduction histidine kinase
MRLLLKLLFYAAAICALCWLVPHIAASFHRATAEGSTPDASRAYALFAVYLLMSAALALFVAWDVARSLGGFASQLFWSGGRIASITPAWWKADRLCRDRQYLEAIRVLREFHEAHPRQWSAAVRIAEIYERDLANPLSAALEYETLLRQRLPKRAQAEILLRLAADYLLLHRTDESAARLNQVLADFPGSAAATKAARRLARLEQRNDADDGQCQVS